MGAWGPGLFQNDVADDVKTDYKDKLKLGKSDELALREIIEENSELLNDDDDKFDFWFGLASILFDLGRLTDEVKNTALSLLDSGEDLPRWEEDKSELKKRRKVLDALREKLLSEQPARKKVPIAKRFVCPWKRNDVFVYTLDSECYKNKPYCGKYLLILVEETVNYDLLEGLGDMLPITYLKTSDKYPETASDIDKALFIPQRFLFYLGDSKNDKSEREHRFMWYKEGFKKFAARLTPWGQCDFKRPYNKPCPYPRIRDEHDFHTTIINFWNRFDEFVIESLDYYGDNL